MESRAQVSTFAEAGVPLGGFDAGIIEAEAIVKRAAACNSPDILDTIVDCASFVMENTDEVAALIERIQANHGWYCRLDAPRYISLVIIHTKYNEGRLNDSIARG